MFAEVLHDARQRAAVSIADLARMARTSRAALTDYEAGRKQPQFSTAERILDSLHTTLVPAPSQPIPQSGTALPQDVVARLCAAQTTPEAAISAAFVVLPQILESDAALENLGLTYGQVKTVASGITISGDPLLVERLWTLRRDIVATLQAARQGQPQPLRSAGEFAEYAVFGDAGLPPLQRGLDYLARATEAGADPARVRHLAGAFLASHGYPYLAVPYKQLGSYGKGVLVCRYSADPAAMLTALTAEVRAPEEAA